MVGTTRRKHTIYGKVDVSKIRAKLGATDKHTERERHNRSVIEQCDDQDHERREIEFEGEGHDREPEDDTDGHSASINRVVSHPLENNTRLPNGVNNGGETRLGEHDVRCAACGIRGTFDGNPDVGARESGSIVRAVAGHSNQVAKTLKSLNDLVLVLREHL